MTECMPDYTLDCMRKLVDLTLARAIPTVGYASHSTYAYICRHNIYASHSTHRERGHTLYYPHTDVSMDMETRRSMEHRMYSWTGDVTLFGGGCMVVCRNQWNPMTPVLIPSKSVFAELCIMQVSHHTTSLPSKIIRGTGAPGGYKGLS